jgi:hypothetical protein
MKNILDFFVKKPILNKNLIKIKTKDQGFSKAAEIIFILGE